MSACTACLRRAWLLSRLGGHLERRRADIDALLILADAELIDALGGRETRRLRAELRRFDPAAARRACDRAGLELICRCDSSYPARLRALDATPAVLHVAGGAERLEGLLELDPVAIVGARNASAYGLEVARSLGRGLAASGVSVVSGMANGIDAAAHEGALEATGATVAVLPGPADRPYPAAKRRLRTRISHAGAVVAELPPGASVWRWAFPARNRIIAALSAAVIVVEAGARSGALLTAGVARRLGRPVGAVPGHLTSPLAAGPNGLIAGGAALIRDPQDVLDLVFGAGERRAVQRERPPLVGAAAELLTAIGEGVDAEVAFDRLELDADAGLAALAELELCGYVRRKAGGRFAVVP